MKKMITLLFKEICKKSLYKIIDVRAFNMSCKIYFFIRRKGLNAFQKVISGFS